MERKVLNLQFPFGGVSRKFFYRKPQEKYTAPWALNVVGDSRPEARLRGGSRPGLSLFAATGVAGAIAACAVPGGIAVVGAAGSERPFALFKDGSAEYPAGMEIVTEGGETLLADGGEGIASSAGVISDTAGFSSSSMVCSNGKVYMADGAVFSVYDLSAGTISKIPSGGAPDGKKILAAWKERMVSAGNDRTVYFSRQGDFSDFDFGADGQDMARAAAIALKSERGGEACAVTALCNILDRYLLIFTEDEVWQLSGVLNGDCALRKLTGSNGAYCPTSVCPDGNGNAMFSGHNGIWRYSMYENGSVQNISGALLPGFSTAESSRDVAVDFDVKLGGWLFFFRDTGETLFYSSADEAFWPFSLPEFPAAVVSGLCSAEARRPFLVFSDGRVARFDWDADNDFGTDISSRVVLGPFFADGTDLRDGILLEVQGSLAEGSAEVSWGSFTRNTAEQCAEAAKGFVKGVGTPDASGVWKTGRNSVDRCRVRGNWTAIVISGTGRWAYGAVTALVGILGRVRNGCVDR